MKTEKKHAPIAVPPLDQQTQNAHLSYFSAFCAFKGSPAWANSPLRF
jgi:hypothetical protein